MKLSELTKTTEYTLLQGTLDADITAMVYDSRKLIPGALFICINGFKTDSHDFIPQALEKGAAALVVEKELDELPETVREAVRASGIAVLRARYARQALATLSEAWFGYPMRDMTVVGFTGTKGKTTSTHMLYAILEAAGRRPGLIGTNGVRYGGLHVPTRNTTPEPYEIQQHARAMRDAGVDTLLMEVSSTGIKYHRVDGIFFDYGVFTNLSPDHIGENEHPDFADYLACKAQLFRRCREGLVNLDDEHCGEICRGATARILGFGKAPEAAYRIQNISFERREGALGCEVQLYDSAAAGEDPARHFFIDMPGEFNAYNALSAAVVADRLGVSWDCIRAGLAHVHVAGRMQTVYSDAQLTVLVDYAHNGVSARTLMETLRSYHPKRLVVVFGCGGNRDPHRRYEMGEACGHTADLSIITADNSRFEKVEDIMKDIHIGLDPTGGASLDIPDRREAIVYAIEHAQPGDIIAVIGKGHEDYQEVEGVRHHFLDSEEIEKALEKRKRTAG